MLENVIAQAEVHFDKSLAGKTYISHQRVGYPFHITRPFYLDPIPAGLLTLYLQSVSGGIYRGEDLLVKINAKTGSLAHVTTQSATIVHRMSNNHHARQEVEITVEDGAFLEYLPDPLIIFPGASFENKTIVKLGYGATAVFCDSFTQHDPKAEGGCFNRLINNTIIQRCDGTIIATDRFDISGDLGEAHLYRKGETLPMHGTLMVLHNGCSSEELNIVLRESLDACSGIYGGASSLPNESGSCLRLLAKDGNCLRQALKRAWIAVRLKVLGSEPGIRPK